MNIKDGPPRKPVKTHVHQPKSVSTVKSVNSFISIDHPIVVDYRQSLKDMIAAGKYDRANPDITWRHFPVRGIGQVKLNAILIHYDQLMSNDDVLADLDRQGLRAATIAELLAFGAAYPNEQLGYRPIVALNPVWMVGLSQANNRVYLARDIHDRLLNILWNNSWTTSYQFLAIRKPVSKI